MVAINVQLNTESVRSTCEHNIFVSTVASLIQNHWLRANLMDERQRHTECWWSRHGCRLHTPLCIKKAPLMDQIAVRQVDRWGCNFFFFFFFTERHTNLLNASKWRNMKQRDPDSTKLNTDIQTDERASTVGWLKENEVEVDRFSKWLCYLGRIQSYPDCG